MHFETENTAELDDFESFMKLNNSVLRYQNVRLDSKPEIVEDETKAQEPEEKEEKDEKEEVKLETVEEETSA